MYADHPDPIERWRSVSDWYAGFAAAPNREYLAPMAGLAAWVGEQPFAAALFPFTSHEWLCVQLRPGYHPASTFFACGLRWWDGQFQCDLEAGSRHLGRKVVPPDQAREAFAEAVRWLVGRSAGR